LNLATTENKLLTAIRFPDFFLFTKFFKFSREVRAGAPPEVNLLTRLTAGQKLAVTPIPERLAALES